MCSLFLHCFWFKSAVIARSIPIKSCIILFAFGKTYNVPLILEFDSLKLKISVIHSTYLKKQEKISKTAMNKIVMSDIKVA